ncbi:hypothetical protein [Turicibacter sp. TJ11]|uniref:hypothetical protein n=1 Tax=Turicibacter sp. TJ11 TaxID=2806443 RepID=UPI001F2F4C76|nr:hypothetical protein [Turicibacter sp. TJ11]
MNLLSEQMQQELTWLEEGNYKYLGFKVLEATIDTSTLERSSQGIIWNPASVNKDKMCRYKVTLENKQGDTFTLEHDLIIKDIIETKQKNPSLVLQDTQTNVVAGMDGEIQTSSFLNNPNTVMSKVLGCTVFNKKERQSLIHCETPTIHYEQYDFPSLYMIISDKSIYVGITYRKLSDRIYEHCTLTKDKTVKAGKSTFEMIAHEGAEVYCIGMFTDYTIEQIEAMSEDEKATYFHKMEQLETIMITLAQKEFSHLKLVNKKQIIEDDDKLKAKVLELPHDLSFRIDWKCWDELHEVEGLAPYSEELEKVARYVYSLVHEVELSDSLISLYETVGVNVLDLLQIVNNVVKPLRTLGKRKIDYNNPTEMPQGRAKDRFDGYFGYRYNLNPTFKKSKPYYKKLVYGGWDNLSVKEMQEKVQEHLDGLYKKRRLYQAYLNDDEGMFSIYPMNNGEVGEEVIFEQYLEEYHIKPIVVYIKVKKKPSNPIQSHQPTTPELKSVDKLIDWDEEDEEWESRFKEEQARFLKIHNRKLKR